MDSEHLDSSVAKFKNPTFLSLEQFVAAPHLSSQFFHHGLELETEVRSPWVVQDKALVR